ncbi:MAG: insulinase family protein [Vampirovibrio sp.]|nr:insulinase family protein [Vampirovibrio sp.]
MLRVIQQSFGHRLAGLFSALFSGVLIISIISCATAVAGSDNTVHEVRLPSGQMLYVQENHDQPIVSIDTWITTGSVNEDEKNNGVSHFLEHLIFKGTDRYRVGEIERLLEGYGANYNGMTSDDYTHYPITIASRFFEDALKIHSNMLLQASIPPGELTSERKVVQEEINRAHNNPTRKLFMGLTQQLFPGHPYSLETLGPKKLIGSMPRKRITEYYHYWYRPENFRTVVVGDVTVKEATELVKKYFPATDFAALQQQTGKYQPEVVSRPIRIKEPAVQVLQDPNIKQAYLGIGFMVPGIEEKKENYALDVAMMSLGQGKSSRLFTRLREDLQLVNSIAAANSTQRHAGVLYIYADTKPENVPAARKAMMTELLRLKTEGITEAELKKAKTQTIKDFIFHTESTGGVASSIGYNVTIGELSDYTEYVDNIQDVTLKDVKAALAKYLNFQHAAVVQVLPEEKTSDIKTEQEEKELLALLDEFSNHSDSSVGPEEPSHIASPEQGPVSNKQTASTQTVTRKKLANGITLIAKPRKESETVAVQIFVKGGRLVEKIPGTAALVSAVLRKETTSRAPEELAQELERQGIQLSVSSKNDYMQISGSAVKEDLGELFLVLQDVLTAPAFSQAEFEKEKLLLKQSIQSSRDNPSSIALENLAMGLYPQHPYGNVGPRVDLHLDLIKRHHLKSYYEQYFVPKNMVVSVVGGFDPERLEHYLLAALPSKLNGRSEITGDLLTQVEPVQPLEKPVTLEEGKPDLAAAWIAHGWLAPMMESKDHVPLKVLNSVLGSGMSSRLFRNIRDKKGLAYVVSSFYPSTHERSKFVLFIGTDPKNEKKVMKGFKQEIKSLKEKPVGEAELRKAKDKLIGEFSLAHETNESQSYFLGLYEMLGHGYQYDFEYPKMIDRVTSEELQQVAAKYFSAPAVTSVVKPEALVPEQAKLEKAKSKTSKKSEKLPSKKKPLQKD